MLGHIKSFLRKHIADESPDAERKQALRLATATLLLEISRADFDTDEAELESIAAALGNAFDLEKSTVRELIAEALNTHEADLSLYPSVKIVNTFCSHEEKYRMLCDLWRVAYADGRLDKYEEYQIRRIADLLYVPHSDFIRAKLSVQNEA